MSIGDPEDYSYSTGTTSTSPSCPNCGTKVYQYDHNDPYAAPIISCRCNATIPTYVTPPLEVQIADLKSQVEELKKEIEALKQVQKKTCKTQRMLLKDNVSFK